MSVETPAALDTLLLIAKRPLPGRVKTRLVPPFSPYQAAMLAACALRDTIDACEAIPARRRVLVFDGDSHGWLPPGWELLPQVGGDLATRLGAAFDWAAQRSSGPTFLVGMDTPQLTSLHVHDVGRDADVDAWFGPADDGGFWGIGFADAHRSAGLFAGVPMSRPDTGALQLAALDRAGLRVAHLPKLTDVDDAGSAAQVASAAAQSRFGGCFRAASGGNAPGVEPHRRAAALASEGER